MRILMALLLTLSLSCATVPNAPPAPQYAPADVALVTFGAGFWLGLSAISTAAFLAVAFYGTDEAACANALRLSFPGLHVEPLHIKPSAPPRGDP